MAPRSPSDAKFIETTVPVDRTTELITALREAGHHAEDTGRRITTDEGPDAEAEIRIALLD